MAAPNLILASNTAGLTALEIGDRPVVQEHQTLVALLESRLGTGYAQMFAEPALGGKSGKAATSVSWFTPRPGAAVSFDRLGAAERAEAEEQLRQRMDRLTGLLGDSQHGALLQRALMVPHVNDIYWVNGTAVLTNWGFVPQSVSPGDPAQMDQHWKTTLGRFVRSGASPWLASASGGTSSKAAEAMTILRGVATAPARTASSGAAPWYMRPLAWGVCGALLVAIGLSAGLGIRLAMREPTLALKDAEALLAAQEALNRSLRRQIDSARGAATGNVCTARDPLGMLDALYATLGRVEGGPAPTAGQRLANVLESAVVQIAVDRDGGAKTFAAGFFVAPAMVLTVREAVEGAKPNAVRVANAAIGATGVPASVKATTSADAGARSYALLTVEPAVGSKAGVLGFAGGVARLNEVIAAGYGTAQPGGDGSAGATRPPAYLAGTAVIGAVDRAPEGKSGPGRVLYAGPAQATGSPLVDRCGRVVAVRSGTVSGDMGGGIAMAVEDLVAWLGEQGVRTTASTARCSPGAS